MSRTILLDPVSLGSFHTARNSIQFSKESLINVKPEDAYKYSKQNSKTSILSYEKLAPPLGHRRIQSNPFDVLYVQDGNISVQTHTPPLGENLNESLYLSQRYKEIEKNIIQGKNGTPPKTLQSKLLSSEAHPIITIIDERNSIKRSGSVISQEATLRNRNKILSRNKVVYKKDIQPVDENKKKVPKLKRLSFPVKRKTSLRRKSKYESLKMKTAKFENENDFFKYFQKINAGTLAFDLIPRTLSLFQFDKLILANPRLSIIDRAIEHKNHQFNIIDDSQNIKISSPLKNTLTKNSKPFGDRNSSNISELEFESPIYSAYKNAVFSKKVLIPPKFAEVFPYNNTHTKYEMHHISKVLLLEILIRRILAAKISYRLRQNRLSRGGKTNSSSGSLSSSQSGSVLFKRWSHRAVIESKPSSSHEDSDRDTFKAGKHGYPEFLPSPQISYQTDIFGSLYSSEPRVTFPDESKHKVSSSILKRNPISPIKEIDQVNFNDQPNSLEDKFINDFNKTYLRRYERKDISNEDNLPFNSNNFQLKPIRRSTDTLSISDRSSSVLEDSLENLQYPSFTKHDEGSSSTKNLKRKSTSIDSNSNSLTRSLDDLSSELSSLSHDMDHKNRAEIIEVGLQEAKYSSENNQLTIANKYSNTLNLHQGTKQNNKSSLNFKDINMGNLIQENQNKLDLRSMIGSISIVETSSSLDSRSYTAHSKKGSNNLNSINEESGHMNFHSTSHLSPKESNYVIGRQDSNSTRSELSNLNKSV